MEQVVPWAALVALIAPYYPEGRTGRSPFSLLTMLRIHFMRQEFTLSDPATEEAFFDTPLYREFDQLDEFGRLPDETPPSCAFATGWRSTNWQSKFWLPRFTPAKMTTINHNERARPPNVIQAESIS